MGTAARDVVRGRIFLPGGVIDRFAGWIISAVKQYSWLDNLATTFAFLGYSLPTFFTGLLFILIFTVKLGWLPEVYTTNIPESGWRWALFMVRQAAMPVAVLAMFQAAELARFVVLPCLKCCTWTTCGQRERRD
jgi:ABC-type dipeptide/oligopeptide/nickel transport system permease component